MKQNTHALEESYSPMFGRKNTQPVVKIVNGVYTFSNLNPDAEHFGLSEDDYYHLCLQLCEVVGRYQGEGFIRNALEDAKADPEITNGYEASSTCDGELIWIGCNVKDDLQELKKFLPDKADRKTVLWCDGPNSQLIFPDGDVSMDVEDPRYSGCYFDYDVDHQFTWTLNGCDFFDFAYNYERAHDI